MSEEQGWQPIETAPKDAHVLVWGEALRWRGMGGIAVGFPHSDYNGHKDVVTLDGRCGPTQPRPTHWMPLPPPPVQP